MLTSRNKEDFIIATKNRAAMKKVLLVNGSPHAAGCTYTALKEIADELAKGGIESEIGNR